MAPGIKVKKGYLDPKVCFDLWMQTNSVYKTARQLANQGIINPQTGKEPTPMGVWNSAWLYVLDNPVEGKQRVSESWKSQGEFLTDPIWYKLVVSKARYLLSPKAFDNYLVKYSYLVPYK